MIEVKQMMKIVQVIQKLIKKPFELLPNRHQTRLEK